VLGSRIQVFLASLKWVMSRLHFTHAGLTTRSYQTDSLQKSSFLLPSSRNILFVKRMESLLHPANKKFEFWNFESRFHKRKILFLVVKTVKCKRGISIKVFQLSRMTTIFKERLQRIFKKKIFEHISSLIFGEKLNIC